MKNLLYIFVMSMLLQTTSFNISNMQEVCKQSMKTEFFKLLAATKMKSFVLDAEEGEKEGGEKEEGGREEKHVKPHVDLPKSYITSVENSIYFHSPITDESSLDLEKRLITLNNNNILEAYAYDHPLKPINLHVQSFGGSLFHTLYLIDLIKKMESPVHTYVDGFAASAGTLISVAGNKRFITKNSLMLVHQLSSGVNGKYSELQDDFHNNELLMNMITNFYLENSKIDRGTLTHLLEHDLWLNSSICLEYGFVDEIL